ncbi:YggS family pyridoxal phosphate-dependent enzyme [Rhodococcus spelaei]|uniref:Pyridoxal phosphate homeostasis protein n=1 Tax=Rhodococcus spelaei TaxID=2546320 RepID=A0A541BMP6_9NOCA|nr:YggS family pyridoxal phosphate-dependent enzyme [Rhodococcus spelaei]TQF73601.1 YggS family pyridoxal phosphate-dependent enzyme [Rhodococcus spelaei]
MSDDRAAQIATALGEVRARLSRACVDAGREPAEVQLLPVTKYFPASDARILYSLGCRDFGESREQEASAKVRELDDLPGVRWHMIGSLQRNKARAVAGWAHTVHSVDSGRLVEALSKGAVAALSDGARTEPLRVLLQVSLDADPGRGGVPPAELPELARHTATAGGLALAGLMAVPPLGADPDAAFETLSGLHRELLHEHPDATTLSAGMTGDLESAVRHGSTCVRVGTALLGSRPITSD